MKARLIALVLITSTLLAGCNDEVYEDKRMGNANDVAIKIEYGIYTRDIADSGYNWYTEYINNFLSPLKPYGYKVDSLMLKKQIERIKQKKNEVSNIDDEKVKKALDKIDNDTMQKEIPDKMFDENIAKSKKNINKNKRTMESMLDEIHKSLELGLDGSYSSDDLTKIKNTQINLIKIYDEKLKDNN